MTCNDAQRMCQKGLRFDFLRFITPLPAVRATRAAIWLWAHGHRFRVETQGNFMARTNPFTFLQQVRSEVAKVVWPTRNETMVSTIMVLIMVTLASVFFLAADQVVAWFVGLLLSIG